MAEKTKITEEVIEITEENTPVEEKNEEPSPKKAEETMSLKEEAEAFKFFKNCSSSLKKLSFITFVINLFLIIITTVIGVVYIGAYIGMQTVTLLAVPLISAVAILVVFARLIPALIYGFGVIVEKHEK